MKRSAGFLLAGLALAALAPADEILVFGAASLTESLQELAKAFESKTGTVVRLSLGSSSDLARQIKAGAPSDVFFSADTAKMDDLEKAGLVQQADRREFLGNQLVVVAPIAAQRPPARPADLAALSRLALADPEGVPAGIYAKKWLESIGLWKELQPKVVPMLDVRAALAAVETEAAPAAIVYKTDAAISRKVKVAFEVENGPEITYSLARVAASKSPAAAAFVNFLSGDEGRAVFQRRGFLVRRERAGRSLPRRSGSGPRDGTPGIRGAMALRTGRPPRSLQECETPGSLGCFSSVPRISRRSGPSNSSTWSTSSSFSSRDIRSSGVCFPVSSRVRSFMTCSLPANGRFKERARPGKAAAIRTQNV